jgi:hypothetical protein
MEIRFALFALPLLAIPIPDPEFPAPVKYAAAFAFASAVLGVATLFPSTRRTINQSIPAATAKVVKASADELNAIKGVFVRKEVIAPVPSVVINPNLVTPEVISTATNAKPVGADK